MEKDILKYSPTVMFRGNMTKKGKQISVKNDYVSEILFLEKLFVLLQRVKYA